MHWKYIRRARSSSTPLLMFQPIMMKSEGLVVMMEGLGQARPLRQTGKALVEVEPHHLVARVEQEAASAVEERGEPRQFAQTFLILFHFHHLEPLTEPVH